MNVIAKISCNFERSVVTQKLQKEYLNTVTDNTPVLLRIKYWTVWYTERYSMSTNMGVTNFQINSPVFWPTLYKFSVTWRNFVFITPGFFSTTGSATLPTRRIWERTDGVSWYAMKLFMPRNFVSFFGDNTEQPYDSTRANQRNSPLFTSYKFDTWTTVTTPITNTGSLYLLLKPKFKTLIWNQELVQNLSQSDTLLKFQLKTKFKTKLTARTKV